MYIVICFAAACRAALMLRSVERAHAELCEMHQLTVTQLVQASEDATSWYAGALQRTCS